MNRLRFRKNDPTHNLMAATQHWVEANGGSLVVVGGVEIVTFPEDLKYNFRVSVRCTGKRPEKATK